MQSHKLLSAFAVAGLATLAMPAQATVWTFTDSAPCTQGDRQSGASLGNTVTCTSDSILSTASAYSNTGDTTSNLNSSTATIESAYLYTWNGLGVANRDGGNTSPNTGDTNDTAGNVPEHATDNQQRNDMVLFNFKENNIDVKVNLTGINIGWVNTSSPSSSDADFTVLAYTGNSAPAPLSGNTFANLSGWSVIGHYNTSGTGDKVISYASGMENTASSYWLIGAYNANVASGATCRNASGGSIGSVSLTGCDDGDDYIKIAALTGTKYTPPPPPGQQVSEPATLGLLGLGLLGMSQLRRRRRA